jgi:hypothetical protein
MLRGRMGLLVGFNCFEELGEGEEGQVVCRESWFVCAIRIRYPPKKDNKL